MRKGQKAQEAQSGPVVTVGAIREGEQEAGLKNVVGRLSAKLPVSEIRNAQEAAE
jgi:hypothetical protein